MGIQAKLFQLVVEREVEQLLKQFSLTDI